MGGIQSLTYAAPVTPKIPGQSPIYRNPMFPENLIDAPTKELTTMKSILLNSIAKNGHRNALGRILKNQNESTIEYITYKTLLNQAQRIGSAIMQMKLFNYDGTLSFIGLYSKNRPQWSILDLACILYNLVSVPIADTSGDESISYVLNHNGLTTLFVNDIGLKGLSKTKNLCKLQNVVCFDAFTQAQVQQFAKRGVKLLHYFTLLSEGELHLKDYNAEEYRVKPQDCITISYTSGTTGPPKGAMLSHRNFASFIAATRFDTQCLFSQDDVTLCYLPLQHVLERQVVYCMLAVSGTVVYYSGDIVNGLKDDLALVKPTIFVSVPRLFTRFHDVIQKKFSQVTGFSKTALDHALSAKLENVRTDGSYTHRLYDSLFFQKTRQALGGRVRLMVSGSAPLLPNVHEFMKVVICAPLRQGYGQTQSTGASFITSGLDPMLRHVGGPVVSFEFKLVDIPQMNYLSTDVDEQGNPTPRGQIWVRGPGVFIGYYKDEEKTKEALTVDGWLKTGDVGALTAHSKGLKIVDRKKNIFKLQQGEYVAPEKVQSAYSKHPSVAEIFLYGDSLETYTVAIIVPHKHWVMELASQLKIEGTFEQLCKNIKIRVQLITQLNQMGKSSGLASFQQAKNVYLETDSLVNKGVVTSTMKVQRHQAKICYKEVLQGLYKEGMLKTEK